MKELAERLGLSRATVSYVLNNRWQEQKINALTAEKVTRYVQAVGFQPDRRALMLRGQLRTDVAILLPENCYKHQEDAFFQLLRAISQRGLSYLVLPVGTNNATTILKELSAMRVERVITLAQTMKWTKEQFRELFEADSTPRHLLYDSRFSAADLEAPRQVCCFFVDRWTAQQRIFDILAEQRRQRIWFPANDLLPKAGSILQVLGSSSELRVTRTPIDESDLIASGAARAAEVLRAADGNYSEAIFCNDDLMAAGMLREFQTRGIAIPEEVALISWDGLDFSALLSPSLTTMEFPHREMIGATCEWLDGKRRESHYEFIPLLRPGKSMQTLHITTNA